MVLALKPRVQNDVELTSKGGGRHTSPSRLMKFECRCRFCIENATLTAPSLPIFQIVVSSSDLTESLACLAALHPAWTGNSPCRAAAALCDVSGLQRVMCSPRSKAARSLTATAFLFYTKISQVPSAADFAVIAVDRIFCCDPIHSRHTEYTSFGASKGNSVVLSRHGFLIFFPATCVCMDT